MTDLTYTCVRNKKTISATGSCNSNEYTKTENLNNTSEEKEKYNYSTHNSQNYAKNTFVRSLISNSKEDTIQFMQTKNIKALCDEDNKQSVKSDIIPLCRKVNKLKDIVQEDKLNIIINNLTDRNCSPKYIDKIIQLLDRLDYIASYKTESECNDSTNHETSKSETMQPSLLCNDNLANTNKLENKLTELNTIGHYTDLGYGSIRNDSNAIQLSNPSNNKPEHDRDSDKSENEIYLGVPKISIRQVLKARETSRKMYKRKEKKKIIYPDAQTHATNLSYNVEEIESVHMVNPINTKKNESCIIITEDEVETTNNMRECHKTIDITQRLQEMTFSNYREAQRNFDMYKESESVTRVQNEQLFDTSNVFVKEQKIPYRIQENPHSQFVVDVDYIINSDIDVVTVSSNTRKTGGNTASQAKMDQNTVRTSENNSDFLEKSCASPKLHKEFIEQTSDLSKSEIAVKKSKPTIISLMSGNLNLRIKIDGKAEQLHDSNIIVKNKSKNANIRSLEETDKKKSMSKTLVATKPVINDSHSKIAVDSNRREVYPIASNKNKTDNINPTNPTTFLITEQLKNSKLGVKENPQVLTAWMPKVVYYAKSKSELGLTFQGKLLK